MLRDLTFTGTLDDLRERDLVVRSVVITRYEDQPAAASFKQRLERRGVRPAFTAPGVLEAARWILGQGRASGHGPV